jgi:hypothetical protein
MKRSTSREADEAVPAFRGTRSCITWVASRRPEDVRTWRLVPPCRLYSSCGWREHKTLDGTLTYATVALSTYLQLQDALWSPSSSFPFWKSAQLSFHFRSTKHENGQAWLIVPPPPSLRYLLLLYLRFPTSSSCRKELSAFRAPLKETRHIEINVPVFMPSATAGPKWNITFVAAARELCMLVTV